RSPGAVTPGRPPHRAATGPRARRPLCHRHPCNVLPGSRVYAGMEPGRKQAPPAARAPRCAWPERVRAYPAAATRAPHPVPLPPPPLPRLSIPLPIGRRDRPGRLRLRGVLRELEERGPAAAASSLGSAGGLTTCEACLRHGWRLRFRDQRQMLQLAEIAAAL